MYKLAARSKYSFKIVQIARWLPDSIVPLFLLKRMGRRKKCTFFQFLSTVYAKVATSNPTLAVLVRYNQAQKCLQYDPKGFHNKLLQNFLKKIEVSTD